MILKDIRSLKTRFTISFYLSTFNTYCKVELWLYHLWGRKFSKCLAILVKITNILQNMLCLLIILILNLMVELYFAYTKVIVSYWFLFGFIWSKWGLANCSHSWFEYQRFSWIKMNTSLHYTQRWWGGGFLTYSFNEKKNYLLSSKR